MQSMLAIHMAVSVLVLIEIANLFLAVDLHQAGKSICKLIKQEDGFELCFFDPDGQRRLVFDDSAVETEDADS